MAGIVNGVQPDFSLWGKSDSKGEVAYPLAAHLLDTGAVLTAYLNGGWVPERHIEYLSELCGAGNPTGFISRVATLAAIHDVGKATPQFQIKLQGAVVADGRTTKSVLDGYPPGITDFPSDNKRLGRHATVSGVALHRVTGPGNFSTDVLAGHHGVFGTEVASWSCDGGGPKRGELPGEHPLGGGCLQLWAHDWKPDDWVEQWCLLTAFCNRAFGSEALQIRSPDAAGIQSGRLAVPFITQLVVLADWIASDEQFREQAPLKDLDDPESYARLQAQAAVERLAAIFGAPVPDTTGRLFAQLFPGLRKFGPRPLQEVVAALPVTPGLTLVAAPMGVGKTEAALIRAFQGTTGIYFALPTGATSKVMFDRVTEFVSTVAGADVAGNVLYRNSSLNEFYAEDPDSPEKAAEQTAENNDDARVVSGTWLRGRHKALLAPVGVGTVDRILHGVFPHRYGFLKLGALAGRTVVLDEVHSYDAYTSALISRLIEWLSVAGADVVMLSATIPTSLVEKFFEAYLCGCRSVAGMREGTPPKLTSFAYPSVLHMQAGISGDVLLQPVVVDEYTLNLKFVEANTPESIADTTLDLIKTRNPCFTAVIVNTVHNAQLVAQRLETRTDIDIYTLHSRMTADQRADAADQVVERFGKDREAMPKRHQVVVSTQIAEQSLDLDADIMVSQLAPIASLLQRSGRLWRHDRPDRLGQRVLYVTRPDETMDKFPYGESKVRRTWEWVLDGGERSTISIPAEVQSLVDLGFDTSAVADVAENQKDGTEQGAAELNALKSPQAIKSVVEFTNGHSNPGELLTRLGADSIGVIMCGSTDWAWNGPLPDRPTVEEQQRILGCVVPVPSKGSCHSVLKQYWSTPAQADGWAIHAPALKGLKQLDLDSSEFIELHQRDGLFAEKEQ